MTTSSQTLFIDRARSRLADRLGLADFKAVMHEIVNELGFSDCHLGTLKGFDGVDFSLSTVPEVIPEYYNEFELVKYDMVIEYLCRDTKPIFHRTIDDYMANAPYTTPFVEVNRDIRKMLDEFEFYDCLIVPVPNEFAGGVKHKTNWKSKGFFMVYNIGESSESFQRNVKAHSFELNILANSFYKYGSNHFVELF